jgi:hypothetical protein
MRDERDYQRILDGFAITFFLAKKFLELGGADLRRYVKAPGAKEVAP